MTKRLANRSETMAPAPRFDVATLRKVASDQVFARGVAYHEDDQVEIISIDRARVLAKVIGSEVYRCELEGAGKKFSGKCSCPAFSDWGFCKHLVATALATNELEPGALEEAAGRFARIRDHLRAKGVEPLVEMIMGLAERDPTLLSELELAAAAATADDETLFSQFKKAITEATRTHGFIEYRDAPAWAEKVESILDRIANLIGSGRAQLVLRLLDHFFARMDGALNAMDDSDGQGGSLYAKACDIHLAACREAKPDPVALARGLFAREVDSGWDFFHGASETYQEMLGAAGLAEYRRLASEAWQEVKPLRPGALRDDQFGRRYCLESILASFAERDGDVDAGIAVRAKDLSMPYSYLQIAQLCLDHGRQAQALKWAEEGLWQFDDRPDERLVFFAVDLYRRMGRKDDAGKLLWQTFERSPSMEVYRRLKRAAGSAAAEVRDRALALLQSQLSAPAGRAAPRYSSPRDLLLELTMSEGLLAQAWELVHKYGCSDDLLASLAQASEKSHPAEALKVHAQQVERMVGLGGQDNYKAACKVIDRMRGIRAHIGENADHAAYLADLMLRHKAKRNFMALLQQHRS
jgi:uncharacterized Zn finger protein